MAKQQQQNPSQGSSAERPSQAQAGSPQDDSGLDQGMDTRGRAGHVSSTDTQYGTHSSMGGYEREAPSAQRDQDQPTRGGAQTGLTGSTSQPSGRQTLSLNRDRHAGAADDDAQSRSHTRPDNASPQASSGLRGAQAGQDQVQTQFQSQAQSMRGAGEREQAPSAAAQPGESGGRSKYSPSANEQDRLSQAQGGESLREERPGAQDAGARDPRHDPSSRSDSPTVRSPADRGSKQTGTHDIDLAGPDSSGTNRDR